MNSTERTELLKNLCGIFGPTGSEAPVADRISEELDKLGYAYKRDRMGNVIVNLHADGAPKLMISAHMDEVGFIINDITDEGYLKFTCLGGIDARVLCGKHVTVEGNDGGYIPGVIASKAIHHQTQEERENVTPVKSMYIDIGAQGRDDAEKLTAVGNSGTFDSDFVEFGEDKSFIKGKAIDDRLGCAEILYVLEKLKGKKVPLDLYFCFTVREEIGLSGAGTAANKIAPDFAIVLESTAVADLPDVPEGKRVAELGAGGAVSLRDRSTIYDRGFVRFALDLADKKGIPAQVKRYVSGGNDAGTIHKTGTGVRALAVSCPSRYIHSPACVISKKDYLSIGELICAVIENFDAEEIKNA